MHGNSCIIHRPKCMEIAASYIGLNAWKTKFARKLRLVTSFKFGLCRTIVREDVSLLTGPNQL